jgi:hypothetical protein
MPLVLKRWAGVHNEAADRWAKKALFVLLCVTIPVIIVK